MERILRRDPLHWSGKVYAGICRRDFLTAHGLRFPPGITHGEDVDFQLRTVVALLLSRTPMTVNPRAVYLYQRRGDSATGGGRITPGWAASLKQVYSGLHELLCAHAAALPPAGVAYQYFTALAVLAGAARSCEQAADARELQALARRLAAGCPGPGALGGVAASRWRQEQSERRQGRHCESLAMPVLRLLAECAPDTGRAASAPQAAAGQADPSRDWR